MADDVKDLVEALIKKGLQSSKPVQAVKKKYDKYKGYYDRAKALVDPDTRSAAVFKELLKFALKEVGSLIGADLAKSPYYILNQKGIDALMEAITAMDTINNARDLLDQGEKDLEKLKEAAKRYDQLYGPKWNEFYETIKLIYNKEGWINYVQNLNMARFDDEKRSDAIDEMQNALSIAKTLLERIQPTVDKIFEWAPLAIQDFSVLSVNAGDIKLAEKTYFEKIGKLADSKGTISSGFGKLEQERKTNERGTDAVTNTGTGGVTLAVRTEKVTHNSSLVARDWHDLFYTCLSPRVLMIGVWGGMELPWDLPLPAK